MLLRHTPETLTERSALTINPAKTCQPVGAMYAALGIHNCLPHSHGSQGCCAYHRSALTRHYKDPIMATTSSFTEGASVFGGQANLVEAINNIFADLQSGRHRRPYHMPLRGHRRRPGPDHKQGHCRWKDPQREKGHPCQYPSFKGSHVTGFSNMTQSHGPLCVGMHREKDQPDQHHPRLRGAFRHGGDQAHRLRDGREHRFSFPIPRAWSTALWTESSICTPRAAPPWKRSEAQGTASLRWPSEERRLWRRQSSSTRNVRCPSRCLDLPIGLRATDAFVDHLRKAAGVGVPESIMTERGQVVDVLTDMHQYFYRKKVALVGDPDHLISLTQFLTDMDMDVCLVVTGTPAGPKFVKRIGEFLGDQKAERVVKYGLGADMFKFPSAHEGRQAGPYLRQHLREIHCPRRGYPPYPHGISHIRPRRTPVFPGRGLSRSATASGKDTERAP